MIYHLYYKEKPGITESANSPYILYSNELASNLTQTFVYTTICLYFRYSLGNLSMVALFAYDGKVCAIKLGLITKKKEPPRTSLYFLSNTL